MPLNPFAGIPASNPARAAVIPKLGVMKPASAMQAPAPNASPGALAALQGMKAPMIKPAVTPTLKQPKLLVNPMAAPKIKNPLT